MYYRIFLLMLIVFLFPSISKGEYKIRLCALKHSPGSMADGDANLAVSAINAAKRAGLDISLTANDDIRGVRSGFKLVNQIFICNFNNDLNKFEKFVSEQMRAGASEGDVFVLFTIGHGFGDGSLQGLGARSGVFKAIAKAAGENNQRTLWWQLSCHAAAGLPAISTLSPEQQELVSVLASSTAAEQSAAGVQGLIMEKVFMAMAKDDTAINPDKNDVITGSELRDFLNKGSNHRGDLLYTRDMAEPIFGGILSLASKIPVVDHSGSRQDFSKGYVLLPSSQ